MKKAQIGLIAIPIIACLIFAGLILIFMPIGTAFIGKTNLETHADKYRAEVKSFYKYNESNIGKTLMDEQLKTEGGVCNHYADYYEKLAKADGFYSGTYLMQLNQSRNHKVAFMSDNSGYCLLDQTSIYCGRIG